ncbi:MAG TPA: helix-turn-helix domain-containing protein [Methylophilaceae bacterium]|nr:helix-turn-helix domain-containing protein [Methylophilaceae bacterium]
MKNEFMTITQVAKLLCVSRTTIKNRMKAGALPQPYIAPRIGLNGRYLFRRSDVEGLLNKTLVPPPGAVTILGDTSLYGELNTRCVRLANRYGRECIIAELARFGVESLGALDKKHYAAFKSRLMYLPLKITKGEVTK